VEENLCLEKHHDRSVRKRKKTIRPSSLLTHTKRKAQKSLKKQKRSTKPEEESKKGKTKLDSHLSNKEPDVGANSSRMRRRRRRFHFSLAWKMKRSSRTRAIRSFFSSAHRTPAGRMKIIQKEMDTLSEISLEEWILG
jgi:hypothetical protein